MGYPWENELPALASLDDQAAADAINAMRVTARRLVPLWEISRLGREAGWWLPSKAAAQTNPFAATFHDYYADTRFDNIDMDLPATQYVLGQMVAGGILTKDQAAAIDALANVPDCPKYDWVLGGQVMETRARQ